MQYVNDDMDELFRRAAEDYPLDTSSADWNKVLTALNDQNAEGQTVPQKGNRRRRFLWLLFLLLLGFVVSQFYSPDASNKQELSKENTLPNVSGAKESSIQQANKTGNAIVTDADQTQSANMDFEKGNTIVGKENQQVNQTSPLQSNTAFINKTSSGKVNSFDNSQKNRSSVGEFLTSNSDKNEFVEHQLSFSRKFTSSVDIQKSFAGFRSTSISRGFIPAVSSPGQNSKQKMQQDRLSKFYFGLIAGIDATTIKFQKIENTGFTYGALLGYQLNKRWSVESGIYVERKYYYSEGKYFDSKKIYPTMPSNFWIDDIFGDCKMIEVPLSAKYNFILHKNSNWFVTAGASSYFMKKESYGYDYYYGNTTVYSHHRIDTANSTKNFFSNLALSAGYSHRLGKFGDVRIEPYVKAPLSGMGIGNVKLFSTGLQLGFTRKF